MPPVEISGIVESCEVNPFSPDPEILVSIICPDPYFTALDPEVITGQTIRTGGTVHHIDYDGTIEAGIYVQVTFVSGAAPTSIGIQVGDPTISYFLIETGVDSSKYIEMSSLPMQKYVQAIDMSTGVISNLLSKVTIQEGSGWPTLQPGEQDFYVITDQGVQDWELVYFERFGGL